MPRFFRVAAIAAFALAGWSCDRSEPTSVAAAGASEVSVYIGDAPGAVRAVWVKIDQIYLISIDGAASGKLTGLLSTPTDLIEITALADSVKALVQGVPVDSGQYNELRFILGGAVLQTKEDRVYTFGDVTPPNGLVATGQLQCPSCSSSGFRVVLDADVKPGTNEIVLDFDVSQSFGHEAGRSGRWIMRPILRALHRHRDREDDGHQGDRFARVSGTVVLGGTAAATIPQCPAGRAHSLGEFVPSLTATTLKNSAGTPIVATGHTDAAGAFKIEKLGADRWTLGYQATTTVSDAGHKLTFTATVSPAEVTLAAGQKATGVKYTITSVTCTVP